MAQEISSTYVGELLACEPPSRTEMPLVGHSVPGPARGAGLPVGRAAWPGARLARNGRARVPLRRRAEPGGQGAIIDKLPRGGYVGVWRARAIVTELPVYAFASASQPSGRRCPLRVLCQRLPMLL